MSSADKLQIFLVMKTKHSVHIAVFVVITSDGEVMTPFISPRDLRLNMKAYIVPGGVEPSLIERVAARRPYIWQ